MSEPRTYAEAMSRVAELQAELSYYRDQTSAEKAVEVHCAFSTRWGLTPLEARLLYVLYRRAGRAVGRDGIMNALYDHDADQPEEKIIDVLVAKVRTKIGRDAILTLFGSGYRLAAAAVEEVTLVLATPVGQLVPADGLHPGVLQNGLSKAVRAYLKASGVATAPDIAIGTGFGHSGVYATLASMRTHGLTAKGARTFPGGRVTWRLTEKGEIRADRERQAAQQERAA